MPAPAFAHLHVHSDHSLLDGAARIDDLVAAALADGQPALGLTDHGTMSGSLDLYRAARDAGIKPIIGTEAYMAAETIDERPAVKCRPKHATPSRAGATLLAEQAEAADQAGPDEVGAMKLYHHLTLLAEATSGYHHLMKLSSAAYLEGYWRKPRVDWTMLETHHDGLIATTGCLGGVVLQALLRGDYERACVLAGRLQDIFGRDNLFVEVQDHGLADQRRTNPQLVALARRIGAPLLATNDCHYTHRHDAVAHDALLCVQTRSTLGQPGRFHFDGDEHYLKSSAEMRSLFAEISEACDNTLLVAERAAVEIDFGHPRLPRFPVPERYPDAASYLAALARGGAKKRYGSPIPEAVAERLAHELAVISEMGFSDYLLICWDLTRHARSVGIRVGPGRGSSAGCLVAYCLKITDVDPIRFDLLFERFLNPGRRQMPDIDMDFDERYRSEMICYAAERYGADHVAQVITFSTIGSRAAVRDAARVLGHPWEVGDAAAKAMPERRFGRDTPLRVCLEEQPGMEEAYRSAAPLRALMTARPEVAQVVDVARGLEGLRRGDSIHASAVVITNRPLGELVPLQRRGDDAPIVTQYDMHGCEALGLLKMDFLGLRNLSVISSALDQVEVNTGRRIDIDGVPLDDPAAYEMLAAGSTTGVFQMESASMRQVIRAVAPTSLDDLAAIVALYRPGPIAAGMPDDYADRKHGRRPVTYPHPDLAEVLAPTYGLMLYQETMMRVAQRIAGYSLEDADNLRKATSKKDRAVMAAERQRFVAGCEATGYGVALADELWAIIEPFADYSFNKSHALAYASLAYKTAWLKCHYPAEYLATLLSSVADDRDKTALYLRECQLLGVEVAVPDINASGAGFVAQPQEASPQRVIRYGFASVKGLGESVASAITSARAAGPFADFYDYVRRVDNPGLNRASVRALIEAGAFTSLGHSRLGLLAASESIVEAELGARKRPSGPSLFGASFHEALQPRIDDDELDDEEVAALERERLGRPVSVQPLAPWADDLDERCDVSLSELADTLDGEEVAVGGMVIEVTRHTVKRTGLPMGIVTLEDLGGATASIVVFSQPWALWGADLAVGAVVVATGRAVPEERKLLADRLVVLGRAPARDTIMAASVG